jgi:predicted RecB family nuclease
MLSPTSIADFLACQHLSALNRAEAVGQIERPFFADPGLDLLAKLGLAHEEAYLRHLTAKENLQIALIATDISWKDAAAQTFRAIRDGAEVVYQATFLAGQWQGRADFLTRVDKPSAVGSWSYEVVETKLARSTKARAIIQLCFYSDLLAEIQGIVPDYMHVVLGGGAQPEKFSVHRYLAYFRKVRREFETANQVRAETYPEPVDHCRVCCWLNAALAQYVVWRIRNFLRWTASVLRL